MGEIRWLMAKLSESRDEVVGIFFVLDVKSCR